MSKSPHICKLGYILSDLFSQEEMENFKIDLHERAEELEKNQNDQNDDIDENAGVQNKSKQPKPLKGIRWRLVDTLQSRLSDGIHYNDNSSHLNFKRD